MELVYFSQGQGCRLWVACLQQRAPVPESAGLRLRKRLRVTSSLCVRLRVTSSLCVRSACLVLEEEQSQPGRADGQGHLLPRGAEGLGSVRGPGRAAALGEADAALQGWPNEPLLGVLAHNLLLPGATPPAEGPQTEDPGGGATSYSPTRAFEPLGSLNPSCFIHKITIALPSEVVRVRRENIVEGACELFCAVHVHVSFLASSPVGAGPAVPVGACQNQDLGAPQRQPGPEGVSTACGTEEADSTAVSSVLSTPQGASHPWAIPGR